MSTLLQSARAAARLVSLGVQHHCDWIAVLRTVQSVPHNSQALPGLTSSSTLPACPSSLNWSARGVSSAAGSTHSRSDSSHSEPCSPPACVRAANGEKLRVVVGVSGGVDSAVAAMLLKREGHDVVGVFMRNWDPVEEGYAEGGGSETSSSAMNSDVSATDIISDSNATNTASSTNSSNGTKKSSSTKSSTHNSTSTTNTLSPAPTPGQLTCVDEEARAAAAVCARLGIAFHEVDFVRQYWDQVFSGFVRAYSEGGTPNPDLACNRNIKFGELLAAARCLGAEAVATGHYAQLQAVDAEDETPKSNSNTRVRLLQGADPLKDQSYFLAAISPDALEHLLFPVGHLHKAAVREVAAQAGLQPLMEGRRSSKGICFVGERRSFGAFMAQYVEPVPGQLLDVATGRTLGSCTDILAFTPGQRARIPGSSQGAWYVAGKDMAAKALVLAQGHDHPALLSNTALLGHPVWLAGEAPSQLQARDAHVDTCPMLSDEVPTQAPSASASDSATAQGRVSLQLQWGRAVQVLAKVSYRQPELVPCWLVVGRWVREGQGSISDTDTSKDSSSTDDEHKGLMSHPARACPEFPPQHFVPSRLHRLSGTPCSTGPPQQLLCEGSALNERVGVAGNRQDHTPVKQLVAVFGSPVRGLAPQQAVVLYEMESSAERGDGRNRVCLGSAALVVPGRTVFEEQNAKKRTH